MIKLPSSKGDYYRNITISGVAGTGSTTLLNTLRGYLSAFGWQGFSGGEYMRQFLDATDLAGGHHDAASYDESVDRKVDTSIRDRLSLESHLIIESWLSGFMAQGVEGVLKILLVCSNDLDRARRLAERDTMSLDEAMLHAFSRLQINTERWQKMYAEEWQAWVVQPQTLSASAPCFFWHPNLYDLVIDTAVYSPEECLHITLDVLNIPEPMGK